MDDTIKIGQNSYTEKEALNQAIKYHKAGEHQKAEYFYHFINKYNPRNADVLHLSSLVLYHYGWVDSAIYWLKRAIVLNNKRPQYYYNLGLLYLDKGDHGEAKKCFTLALECNADYQLAKNELMRLN